jgi:hypothetical protein
MNRIVATQPFKIGMPDVVAVELWITDINLV